MSTVTVKADEPVRTASGTTTSYGRMAAIGRAELTLLVRNKSAVFMALAMPVLMTFSFKAAADEMDLSGTGLSVATVLLPGAIGFVLLFAVYGNLTTTFVARREELVLKRLRTGELSDGEILTGTAMPAALTGLAQIVLLAAGGAVVLEAPAPQEPWWLVAGVACGMIMVAGFAALSATYARTVETAGLIVLPLMLISALGSGMVVPMELMPDRVAPYLEVLPLSPVMALVRQGWTGGADAAEMLRHLLVAVVWTGIAVFAVRRKFRWEPRR